MEQFSTSFLATFKTIPNSCVYAVISDSSMKCFISHSNHLKARIGAIIDQFKYEDVRLVVLQKMKPSTDPGIVEGKLLLCEKYKRMFQDLGYGIVGNKVYINYKASIRFSRNAKKVYVVLHNKRRDKKVVGQFKSVLDAQMFIDQYYVNKEGVVPVYAIGENKYIND